MVRIETRIRIEAPIRRCFDLARSIDAHRFASGASREEAIGGTTQGLIGLGEFVRWRATHFGFRQTLTSKITAFEPPSYFQDTMTEGAFAFMQHDHRFIALEPQATEMCDDFRFAAPVPLLGWWSEQLVLRRYMTRFLIDRNAVLKRLAESNDWRAFVPE